MGGRVLKHFTHFFSVFALLVCINGCRQIGMASTDPQPTGVINSTAVQTAVQSTPAVDATRPVIPTLATDLAAAILSNPETYVGKQVAIVGFYRGWDLLKEAGGSPPVTRSDWVIADRSGAIYVTGAAPQGLDPSSMQDTNKLVRLTATVERNQLRTYLRGISVEILTNP